MRQSVLVSFQNLSILPYEIYCTCISFILDIDECNDGTDLCDTNANCTNTNGSYECICNSGYEGSGLTCRSKLCGHCEKTALACLLIDMFYFTDVNECEEMNITCDQNAECMDIMGNYACVCHSGYTGNGISNCSKLEG